MFKGQNIAVVVPCHNEERNLAKVIATMPDYVDKIYVIDDASTDGTKLLGENLASTYAKVKFIHLATNQGVGGAIAEGYKAALSDPIDIAVVMAGDGQMDPIHLPRLLNPIVDGKCDYSKTNRLFDHSSKSEIPKIRYLGNFILSVLTKIATGYWHISDAQSGYSAINRDALAKLDWDSMYKRFGQPNDLLAMLNGYDFRVMDIHTPPLYDVGEVSKMKIRKVIFTIPKILVKRFWWRMWTKYVVRNSHPLVLLYFTSVFFGVTSIIFLVHLVMVLIASGSIPLLSAIAFLFSLSVAFQTASFAMWMDMQVNHLLHRDIL